MDREKEKAVLITLVSISVIFMLGFHCGKALASEDYQRGYERGYCHGKGVECLPPIQEPERPSNINEGVDPESIQLRGFYDGAMDSEQDENRYDLGEPRSEDEDEW